MSLSRSNIRSKASGDGASPYPATDVRTCCLLIDDGAFTSAMTRFSRRSAGGIWEGIGTTLLACSVAV